MTAKEKVRTCRQRAVDVADLDRQWGLLDGTGLDTFSVDMYGAVFLQSLWLPTAAAEFSFVCRAENVLKAGFTPFATSIWQHKKATQDVRILKENMVRTLALPAGST